MVRHVMMTSGKILSGSEEVSSKQSLPPGFRFHPTNEELISYYLTKKVLGKSCFDAIAEVDIYKHQPSDLKEYSKLKTRDEEWYFFSSVVKKYDTGSRVSRKTKEGYWKATGKDREVHGGDELIGMIKTLVFHKGRAPEGRRTNWVIHEYRLVDYKPENNESPKKEQSEYVLCKLFFKNDIGPPSGNRYAAFVEEEWEEWDEKSLIDVGNVKAREVHVPADLDESTDKIEILQQEKKQYFDLNEFPREFEIDEDETHNESHKRKYAGEALLHCAFNKEAPLPLVQYKRKRNSSGNYSNQTTQDHASSRATSTDLMKAETMIKILQGEINALREENEKLKKKSSNKRRWS